MYGLNPPLHFREITYRRRLIGGHVLAAVVLVVVGMAIRVSVGPTAPKVGIRGPRVVSDRIENLEDRLAEADMHAAGHPLPDALVAIEIASELEEVHEAEEIPARVRTGETRPKPIEFEPETTPGPSIGSGSAGVTAAPLAVTSDQIMILELYKPAYPPDARLLGQEGTLHVRVHVGTDGRVIRVDPVDPQSMLTSMVDAAVEAALKWRFEPIEVEGRAREFAITLPITYTLPN